LLAFGRFPGRLAQLGERRLDKAEVTGSSPVSPMEKTLLNAGFSCLEGPNRVPFAAWSAPWLGDRRLGWRTPPAGPWPKRLRLVGSRPGSRPLGRRRRCDGVEPDELELHPGLRAALDLRGVGLTDALFVRSHPSCWRAQMLDFVDCSWITYYGRHLTIEARLGAGGPCSS
jgi:hypothetical protein